MSIGRKEAIAVSIGVLLVVAAFVVPNLHLGIVTPMIKMRPADLKAFADAAPISAGGTPTSAGAPCPPS